MSTSALQIAPWNGVHALSPTPPPASSGIRQCVQVSETSLLRGHSDWASHLEENLCFCHQQFLELQIYESKSPGIRNIPLPQKATGKCQNLSHLQLRAHRRGFSEI